MCQRAIKGESMSFQASRCSVISPPPLAFTCHPASGRAVRRHVRDRAVSVGRLELADDAEAVAGELFANAIEAQLRQRVTTVINVQLVVQGGSVVVEVYDHAQGGPFLRDLGREWQTAEHGRGMWLVNSITRGAWRWEPWATGKVVVAVITQPLPGDPRVAHVAC
jgi:anti-sigma regulatory factor (Ser/Thr protein kinase)